MTIRPQLHMCPTFLAAGVLAAVLAVLTLASGAAAQTPLLYVEPDSVTVPHLGTFTLDIDVSDVIGLMGYDITVTFDSDVIELLGVTEGSLPLLSGYPTFFYWYDGVLPTDSVHINGAILGNTVDGPGTLFTLEFEGHAPNGDQTTDVTIVLSVMRNGVNEDIVHDVAPGWVKVVTPVRTETMSWGVVKSLYSR